MIDEDFETLKMIEALTLERVLVDALSPPYWVGFMDDFIDWRKNAYHTRSGEGHSDITYLNPEGQLHRLTGPAYISKVHKFEIWYKNGLIHRDGGPAIIHKTDFVWLKEGQYHNLNGPAMVSLGRNPRYFIDGRKYSPKEYKKEIARMRKRGLIK